MWVQILSLNGDEILSGKCGELSEVLISEKWWGPLTKHSESHACVLTNIASIIDYSCDVDI